MAKYQHRYRGASAADVMLAVDSTREEYEEIKAYEEYLKKLREQNKKKRRGGLFGSILGAVIGFATGGVSAALIGSTVGGAAATQGSGLAISIAALNPVKSLELTQAGNIVDIDSTTGFARRKLSATGAVDLVTMANELVEPKDSVAAKIYIRNIGYKDVIDKSVGVTIGVNAETIGKLYGGDWMMMPLTCIDADDVTVNPDTNDTVVIEYVMFFEEA